MLNINDQYEHYNSYVDNCNVDEIPLTFEDWTSEYLSDLSKMLCFNEGIN